MDIYAAVTDRIIAQMEQGIIPWHKPWVACGSAISRSTGKPYSLLNQMLLGRPGEYVTFKQCQQEGCKVKKGEKASMVVFWKWIEEKDPETEEVKQIPFLRYYNVFHIDQCEGLTSKHAPVMPDTASADQNADQIIDGYVQRSGVKLMHRDGGRAFYQPLQMVGVFSEVELQMTRSRVRSGLANCRARGVKLGRPRKTKEDIPAIFLKHYPTYASGKMNVSELARVCGFSRPTIYKYLRLTK